MRLFVAVELSAGLKERAIEVQRRITGVEAKLIEPENLHFNLKFIGEVESDKPPDVIRVMDKALIGSKAFKMRLKGLGAFPDKNYIRVVWIGVSEGKVELSNIQNALEKTFYEELGLHKELRHYEPHLTLARIQSEQGKARLQNLIAELEGTDFGEMTVREVKLYESNLTPHGPVYKILHTVKLSE